MLFTHISWVRSCHQAVKTREETVTSGCDEKRNRWINQTLLEHLLESFFTI